jgi:two-component system sensor histidine kinase DesK
MSLLGSPSADTRRGSLPGEPQDGAWRPFYRLVGLLFVVFPIATILSTRPDPLEVVLVLGGTALFGIVMIRGTRVPLPDADGLVRPFGLSRTPAEIARDAGPTIVAVAGLILLSIALTLLRPDGGWFAFFYYASVSASTIRIPRVAIALMVVTGIAAALSFVVARDNPADAFVQGLSVTVIGLTVFSAIAVRRTNRALVAARDELARLAVADERARIARDLHDTLGHDLSVIALKSELAGRLLPGDPARAGSEIADVERVAREALTAVRGTIGGYRQPTLANELAGARSALAAAGIEGRVEPAPERLPATADAILGWAVREGVTNVVRHGRGRSAEIRVEITESDAAVEIRNDPPRGDGPSGLAIAPDRTRSAGSGTGLAGLRERVATVGGRVEAGPLPDGGFRLRVSLPIGPGSSFPPEPAGAPA